MTVRRMNSCVGNNLLWPPQMSGNRPSATSFNRSGVMEIRLVLHDEAFSLRRYLQ